MDVAGEEFAVSFLAKKCVPMSDVDVKRCLKLVKPPRGHPESELLPVMISGLTSKEVEMLNKNCLSSRQNVFSDISSFYAWKNPVSGYALTEKIADMVRRITNEKDIVETLQLPTKKTRYPSQHSDMEFVQKAHQCTMDAIRAKSEATSARFSEKGAGSAKPVEFKTFWCDGFMMCRRFVCNCSVILKCSHKNAVQHCSLLGRNVVTTKVSVREVMKQWENGISAPKELEAHPDEMSDSCAEQTHEEMCASVRKQNKINPECDPVEAHELFPLLKRIALRQIAKAKKERKRIKPDQTRKNVKLDGPPKKAKAKKGRKRVKKAKPDQRQKRAKSDPTLKGPKTIRGEATTVAKKSAVSDVLAAELPLFDVNASVDPTDEHLVLEMPHLDQRDSSEDMEEDTEMGNRPHLSNGLIKGNVCVPEGGKELKLVLFIKLRDVLAHTFERADVTCHGQATGKEKGDVEQRCQSQNVPFMTAVPGDRLFSLHGVHLAHHSCGVHKECFDGLKLDVKRTHECLKGTATRADRDRGTIQVTMGCSTRNCESTKKHKEELEERMLDGPDWSGTTTDFDELAPQVRDIIDRPQAMVNKLCPKPNKQMTNELRCETHAKRLNKLMMCAVNRFEVWTVAIAHPDPRSNVILRHVDKFNDHRKGHTVTATWSAVFRADEHIPSVLRLSIIGYTRKQVGNHIDRISGCVSTFKTRINELMASDHCTEVNNHKELNLSELAARSGMLAREGVWKEDDVNTISCVVLPMHFDPCAFFSAFAWCITRMRRKWKLTRSQVVELVHMACAPSMVDSATEDTITSNLRAWPSFTSCESFAKTFSSLLTIPGKCDKQT